MGGFGNSYEQTIGIITAGTEIMVGQPSKVARGWRTIGANITKLAKETDTYRDASGKVNIEMRKQDGTMKNTYEFLTDLHKQWGNLNNEQKTAIALQFGGKNQMEVFMATMNNFGTAIKATNTAMDAQGSAARENGRYLESLAGHVANLRSAWEEFSYKMVNSDWLKKGIDLLADFLHILSSDAGQAIIKLTLLATALNLGAKAILGFKGLSIIKLFTGMGKASKGAKEAADALTIMQRAQVGATKGAVPLYSVFGKLTGSLLGTGGLVAGIGLLSVALSKYVPIGERARDIKLGKELKEAQSDVEKTEKKYKSLRDELDKLHEKEKEGTLTDSEQNRLNILENQTKQYERQLELKKEIAGNKADEYYHTVDPNKLEGRAKEKYTLAKSAGKSDKEALAAAGVNDKIALSLNNLKARSEEVVKAQEKVTEAYEHHGKSSKEYKDALEELGKAEDNQGDVLTKLESQRKKAIESFGDEAKASKSLGKSWSSLNLEIKALKTLQGINFKSPAKDMDKLKQSANTLGLEFNKSGKKIKSIDLKTFQTQMSMAGHSVEDTYNYIKELSKDNPKMKIDVDGTKVAIKDLEFVDGKIQKIKKEKPEVKPEVKTADATAKLDAYQKKLDKLNGKSSIAKLGVRTSKGGLGDLAKSIDKIKGKSVKVKATAIGKGAVDKLKSAISGLKDKIVHVTTKKKTVDEKHGVRHFAGGGEMVNAQVNEQGFEIIQDADTGLMRVVNGGKRGYTYLGRGDTVYTHGQSVRMLRNAGRTEGNTIYGHGDEDFSISGVRKPEGFAKGLTKKQYKKKYKAIVSDFDKALAKLEYKRDYYHWSNQEYASEYTKLYDQYNTKLANLNKQKVKKGVSKSTTLGTDRVRAYNLAQSDVESEQFKENIESTLKDIIGDATGLEAMLKAIEEADKAQRITADETAEFIKEAYKTNAEYNMKQFKNNKETYVNMRKLLEDYYADGKLSGEDYYDFLDELAEEQLDKERERLSERLDKTENTYDLAKAYVQRQIDLLETENEEQEKQNELVELQNNLAKARNQRIRIYKEGEGFVYEQDTEAIREATQALQDYKAESAGAENAVNPVLKQWQDVLDLFDDLEADYELKALENKVGSTVGALFGGMGTSTSAWSDWIKNNLSTSYGLQDVLDQMDKLVDTEDILGYLDQNGKVTDAIIDAAIGNNILPATYAAAITQAAQGIGAIANTGASIATQSAISSLTSGAIVMSGGTQYGNVYNFDNLVLPNVTNATEFVNSLDNLPNTALQVSTQRN